MYTDISDSEHTSYPISGICIAHSSSIAPLSLVAIRLSSMNSMGGPKNMAEPLAGFDGYACQQ